MTSAKHRKAALITELRRQGSSTRNRTENQPAPRLRAASTRTRASIARIPASRVRKTNGIASMTYRKASSSGCLPSRMNSSTERSAGLCTRA